MYVKIKWGNCLFYCIVSLLPPLAAVAQQQDFYGNQVSHEQCLNATYTPDPQVTQLINRIVKVVGFESSYIVRPCPSVEGCVATVDNRGRPYILYEPAYLMRVKGMGFTSAQMPTATADWNVMHVLAHEVAHHLRNHLTNPNPAKIQSELELEADETAGYLMYMLGAPNLRIAQQALHGSEVPVNGSVTHPPRAQRLAAFRTGWENAETKFPRSPVVQPPTDKVDEPLRDANAPSMYTDPLVGTFVLVRSGHFNMGCTDEQQDCAGKEKPVRRVGVDSYYIGQYEVTQAQWRAVMGDNPSLFVGCEQCPVEQVSWEDVQEFLRRLNERTRQNYRLPTEAEWEFAARGGREGRGYQYAGSNEAEAVAWHAVNAGSMTHAVGQKMPNELRLYDMSGNVWEWCQDWFGNYPSVGENNPPGAAKGAARISRGGSWNFDSRFCRVARRSNLVPTERYSDLGFRLARTP